MNILTFCKIRQHIRNTILFQILMNVIFLIITKEPFFLVTLLFITGFAVDVVDYCKNQIAVDYCGQQ